MNPSNYQFPFTSQGGEYTLNAQLNIVKEEKQLSLHTKAGNVTIDYWSPLGPAGRTRLHMFLGASEKAEYEEKLRRMHHFAEMITIYDSIMTNSSFDESSVRTLLQSKRLPRITTIEGDTERKGLVELFSYFDFPRAIYENRPFLIPWHKLANVAASGELVNIWKMLKSKEA